MDLHTAGHRRGVVCAPHAAAAEAGRAVLAEGGNALEAMVAMAATIAVVYPHMNGIGGDGFWLVREPSGRVRALMAAGRAGEHARPELYRELRRDPVARAAGGADGAGRDRRLDAGARMPPKALGGKLPLDVLLGHAIRQAARRHAGGAQPRGLTAAVAGELKLVPGFRADLPGRRQAAGRPATCCASRRSPRRWSSSPMPGLPISIAATSGARSPPISNASAAR